MPYVYSTSTAGVDFTGYRPRIPGQHNVVDRKVSIAGGSNVANKNLITPIGVPTKVTDEELAFLREHEVFNRMMKNGFFKVVKDKAEPEAVIADMETRDESAPFVPGDFTADKEPQAGAARKKRAA